MYSLCRFIIVGEPGLEMVKDSDITNMAKRMKEWVSLTFLSTICIPYHAELTEPNNSPPLSGFTNDMLTLLPPDECLATKRTQVCCKAPTMTGEHQLLFKKNGWLKTVEDQIRKPYKAVLIIEVLEFLSDHIVSSLLQLLSQHINRILLRIRIRLYDLGVCTKDLETFQIRSKMNVAKLLSHSWNIAYSGITSSAPEGLCEYGRSHHDNQALSDCSDLFTRNSFIWSNPYANMSCDRNLRTTTLYEFAAVSRNRVNARLKNNNNGEEYKCREAIDNLENIQMQQLHNLTEMGRLDPLVIESNSSEQKISFQDMLTCLHSELRRKYQAKSLENEVDLPCPRVHDIRLLPSVKISSTTTTVCVQPNRYTVFINVSKFGSSFAKTMLLTCIRTLRAPTFVQDHVLSAPSLATYAIGIEWANPCSSLEASGRFYISGDTDNDIINSWEWKIKSPDSIVTRNYKTQKESDNIFAQMDDWLAGSPPILLDPVMLKVVTNISSIWTVQKDGKVSKYDIKIGPKCISVVRLAFDQMSQDIFEGFLECGQAVVTLISLSLNFVTIYWSSMDYSDLFAKESLRLAKSFPLFSVPCCSQAFAKPVTSIAPGRLTRLEKDLEKLLGLSGSGFLRKIYQKRFWHARTRYTDLGGPIPLDWPTISSVFTQLTTKQDLLNLFSGSRLSRSILNEVDAFLDKNSGEWLQASLSTENAKQLSGLTKFNSFSNGLSKLFRVDLIQNLTLLATAASVAADRQAHPYDALVFLVQGSIYWTVCIPAQDVAEDLNEADACSAEILENKECQFNPRKTKQCDTFLGSAGEFLYIPRGAEYNLTATEKDKSAYLAFGLSESNMSWTSLFERLVIPKCLPRNVSKHAILAVEQSFQTVTKSYPSGLSWQRLAPNWLSKVELYKKHFFRLCRQWKLFTFQEMLRQNLQEEFNAMFKNICSKACFDSTISKTLKT
eukprot:m.36050 g.36050  ORF g.36050 m.36050 type:complete len:949 (-) comp9009_c0_seq1:106-2952(-)